MADYKQPPDVERRVRFFDGQYLQEQDFIDEQKYHIDRQRRHNRLLHVAGVADGLMVSKKGAAVSVSAGTAIDSDGRQLVLADAQPFDAFPSALKSKTVCLYLLYKEDPVDLQKQAGSPDNSRWLEKPVIKAAAKGEKFEFDYPPVLLAELALDSSGAITGNINNQVRDYSGLRLPGPDTDAPVLRTAASGLVNLQGGLTVTGKVGIGTTGPAEKLQVSGGKIQLDGNQQIKFTATDTSNNLKLQLWTGYGLGINDSTLFYAANGYHSWRGQNGANESERMVLSTAADGGLTVKGTGNSSFAGNVGIGATAPAAKLSVMGGVHIGGTSDPGNNNLVVEGNVGIGTTGPVATLDVSGKANKLGQVSLQLRSGNYATNYDSNQITLGWENKAQYRHAIKTRHNSAARSGNAIDFYVWKYLSASDKDGVDTIGTLHTMTLDGGNVGIGATGPEAKLDVNGDVIVSGVIKGRYKETRNLDALESFKKDSLRKGYINSVEKQQPAIIQGFGLGITANLSGNTADPHLFAIGYARGGDYYQSPHIIDITTGAYKTFIIDHPLHQDRYLMHATLEGPEGAVYYRGTARLENGRAQVQLPDYFEALARSEGRTLLLTNVDGFDPLAVLTQDGAQIKDGRFIVVSSNKESNQAFDWEVKAIRKDVQALEVEPMKDSIQVQRFGPYAYAVPANADKMRAPPLHAYPSTAGPRPGTGHIPGACGPRSKITNIR